MGEKQAKNNIFITIINNTKNVYNKVSKIDIGKWLKRQIRNIKIIGIPLAIATLLWISYSYRFNHQDLLVAKCYYGELYKGDKPDYYILIYMRFHSYFFTHEKEIYPSKLILFDKESKVICSTFDIVDKVDYENLVLPEISRKIRKYNLDPKGVYMIHPADSVDNGHGVFIAPKKFPVLNSELFSYPFTPSADSPSEKIIIYKLNSEGEGFSFAYKGFRKFYFEGKNVPHKLFFFRKQWTLFEEFGFRLDGFSPEKHEMPVSESIEILFNDLADAIVYKERDTSENNDIIKYYIEKLETVSKHYPKDSDVIIHIALLRSIVNDDNNSIDQTISNLLQKKDYEYIANLLYTYFHLSAAIHYHLAVNNYLSDIAVKAFPHDDKINNYRGLCLWGIKQYQQAIDVFNEIELNEYNADIYYDAQFNKALVYLFQKKFGFSYNTLRRLEIESYIPKNDIYTLEIMNLEGMGKMEEAKDILKKIPTYYVNYESLQNLLYGDGKLTGCYLSPRY